jgi:3-hydroxyisobutyrate dehydrogenase-like beta-hydroxyacid dehydrogenase
MKAVKTALVALSLGLALGTAAARDEAMVVPERITVAGKAGLTQAKLHDALIRAAARRNWIVQNDVPGELLVKQSRQGKHEATVKMVYDDTSYQLVYANSYNLNVDTDAKRIHPTYNMWIRNLSNDVASEVSLIGLN